MWIEAHSRSGPDHTFTADRNRHVLLEVFHYENTALSEGVDHQVHGPDAIGHVFQNPFSSTAPSTVPGPVPERVSSGARSTP